MKTLETEFQSFCTLVRKEATVLHKFLAAQLQKKFSVMGTPHFMDIS